MKNLSITSSPVLASAPLRRTARPIASRKVLAALAGVMAANAYAGAWYAIRGAPNVPTDWLEGTPFGSYAVPGLILGIAVGGTQTAAAATLWRGGREARVVAMGASAVLIVWILTQLSLIGYVSPLQPIVLTWGALSFVAAARLTATEAAC
ncbi:MAG: hypothetical protein JHC95_01810 [Solirubrobacteraceae bacterium]|nr:hypothetical protein [Solirubrobacteraceae bacterium]